MYYETGICLERINYCRDILIFSNRWFAVERATQLRKQLDHWYKVVNSKQLSGKRLLTVKRVTYFIRGCLLSRMQHITVDNHRFGKKLITVEIA